MFKKFGMNYCLSQWCKLRRYCHKALGTQLVQSIRNNLKEYKNDEIDLKSKRTTYHMNILHDIGLLLNGCTIYHILIAVSVY